MTSETEIEAMMEVLARGLNLPLNAQNHASILANLATAHRLAAGFLTFPVPDHVEPAPIYDPAA